MSHLRPLEPHTEVSDPLLLASQPLVSVLMLTYNHARYLPDAIHGVLSQEGNHPIELLIGEDCSTDSTRSIALHYQKAHPGVIRVILSERNVGAFDNSRRLISLARGSYIAYCEGDDYWHLPSKLTQQLALMQRRPEVVAVHTDYDRRIGSRVRRNVHATRPPRYPAVGAAYSNLLRGWTVMTATSMYRAHVLKDFIGSPFNRADFPFGDYNKLLFASLRGEIGYIPVSTATWRKVPGSASNAGFRARLRLMTAALECREQFLRSHPIDGRTADEAIALAHRDIANAAFLAGDTKLFVQSVHEICGLGFAELVPEFSMVKQLAMRLKLPLSFMRGIKKFVLWAGTLEGLGFRANQGPSRAGGRPS